MWVPMVVYCQRKCWEPDSQNRQLWKFLPGPGAVWRREATQGQKVPAACGAVANLGHAVANLGHPVSREHFTPHVPTLDCKKTVRNSWCDLN